MVGKRNPQRQLFELSNVYADYVGRESFYGFLSVHRGELFADEDFAELYCVNNGRPSVPPSLLAMALVLQTYEGVSDEEAHRRAAYDLQWKVALGVELEEKPFGKSTLCEFRAQLVVHEKQAEIFKKSLKLARQRGYLKQQHKLTVALDTTNILGRGAVKDTLNLLADGIVLVGRELARQAGETLEAWAAREGYDLYVNEPSMKGALNIDWEDQAQRKAAVARVVADADRLLELVRQRRGQTPEDSAEDAAVAEAAGRLSRVLVQDIERKPKSESKPTPEAKPTAESKRAEPVVRRSLDGSAAGSSEETAVAAEEQEPPRPEIRVGVARDRMPAIHDPEARHGRKSKAHRFVGHKAQIAVDATSQVIVGYAVSSGNAPDAEGALDLVQQAEKNSACTVEETIGDCAYGSGATRQQFEDAGRALVAKVPGMTNQGRFPKTAFTLDLEAGTCTCPAQQVTTDLRGLGQRRFQFALAQCGPCPLRDQCIRGKRARSVQVHPQEALVQRARQFQHSPPFAVYRARRQVVEHRLARLVQLGIRQARYIGRAKTDFQLALAATVANLTLIANGNLHLSPAR